MAVFFYYLNLIICQADNFYAFIVILLIVAPMSGVLGITNEHETSAADNHPARALVETVRYEQDFHEYRYDLILREQFKDTEAVRLLAIIGDILRDSPELRSYDNLAFDFGGLVGLRVATGVLSEESFRKLHDHLSLLLLTAYQISDRYPISKRPGVLTNSILGYAALGEQQAGEYATIIHDPDMAVYVSKNGIGAMEDGFGIVIAAMNEVIETEPHETY